MAFLKKKSKQGGAVLAPRTKMKRSFFEGIIENTIFASRWLLAPMYVGLLLTLFGLLVVFGRELIHMAQLVFVGSLNAEDAIVLVLSMIDLSLAANLVLIIVFSGFENFVSKLENEDHPDRPEWLGKIDFGGLKLKLIASVAAISAIQLLKVFVNIDQVTPDKIFWLVAIHLTFIVSGVLLALMDFITAKSKSFGYEGD